MKETWTQDIQAVIDFHGPLLEAEKRAQNNEAVQKTLLRAEHFLGKEEIMPVDVRTYLASRTVGPYSTTVAKFDKSLSVLLEIHEEHKPSLPFRAKTKNSKPQSFPYGKGQFIITTTTVEYIDEDGILSWRLFNTFSGKFDWVHRELSFQNGDGKNICSVALAFIDKTTKETLKEQAQAVIKAVLTR